MTKAAASGRLSGEVSRRDHEVGLGLAFDAGRALGEGQAGDPDAEPARHGAQRVDGRVDAVGDGLRRVGVDDVERAHDLASCVGPRRLLDLDLVALGIVEDEGADADGVVHEKLREVRDALALA
jgi:hypothetical protein